MSATSQPAQSTPPADPATNRRTAGGALSLGKRFLTLREGSIIVVTLIAAIYFSSQTSRFLTTAASKRCCRSSPPSRSSRPARCS